MFDNSAIWIIEGSFSNSPPCAQPSYQTQFAAGTTDTLSCFRVFERAVCCSFVVGCLVSSSEQESSNVDGPPCLTTAVFSAVRVVWTFSVTGFFLLKRSTCFRSDDRGSAVESKNVGSRYCDTSHCRRVGFAFFPLSPTFQANITLPKSVRELRRLPRAAPRRDKRILRSGKHAWNTSRIRACFARSLETRREGWFPTFKTWTDYITWLYYLNYDYLCPGRVCSTLDDVSPISPDKNNYRVSVNWATDVYKIF